MSDNVTNLPTPGVVLDLDLEQKPEKYRKDPFVFKINDRVIEMADPTDLDWRDLASVEIPADLFRVTLSREDRDFLEDLDLPSWKFGRLMEVYSQHYDIEDQLEKARRRQAAERR